MSKAKFPSTLGACVDTLYLLDQKRLAKQREFKAKLAEIEEQQAALEEYVIQRFNKDEIEAARGEVATVSLIETPEPDNVDWPTVWAFIKKTGAFDLLEKRIAKVAWRERLNTKDRVPGVDVFVKKSLSLRKRS